MAFLYSLLKSLIKIVASIDKSFSKVNNVKKWSSCLCWQRAKAAPIYCCGTDNETPVNQITVSQDLLENNELFGPFVRFSLPYGVQLLISIFTARHVFPFSGISAWTFLFW